MREKQMMKMAVVVVHGFKHVQVNLRKDHYSSVGTRPDPKNVLSEKKTPERVAAVERGRSGAPARSSRPPCRPPRVRFPPRPPLAPSTVSLPPLRGRGEGGASSAARGPEVLPSAAAGGSEPPPLPARRGPPTRPWAGVVLVGGLPPSLVPSGAGGGGDTPAGSARTGVSTPNSRADGRTPSLRGSARPPPSLSSPPGGGEGGGDTSARFCEDRGSRPPTLAPTGGRRRCEGQRPWGFPDGVRCAPGGDRLDSGQPPVPLGIAERPPRPPPSTTSEVNGWGPHGLPEDSTRRVRSARSVRCDPFGGDRRPAVGSAAVGALLPRRCAATARFGQEGSGEGGSQPPVASFTEPPRPTLPPPRVVGSVLAPSLLPTGGTGPSLPVCASTGRTVLSPSPTAPAPSGRDQALVKGARGPRRGRPPTRPALKHGPRSLTHARVKGCPRAPRRNEGEGRRRRSRWDPRPRGRTTARLARTAGQVELERSDGTRKMVNYAWQGEARGNSGGGPQRS
ncbi:hypothetical protein G5714_005195 [Onychostoma macrolepis]|uniref:Uncharacterized protein n=1 Tax=Onychostoma macrolepis TaxID=369639 RepID=A0A7J6D752_9TELE|nr:hypothetical protein G5714_005195 [Onychostoma macrolepis]